MTISVRGSAISYTTNSVATASISFPAGTVAGDTCVIFLAHDSAVSAPYGWNQVDSSNVAGINGGTFRKVLTAADIARGLVTVAFASAGWGVVAVISFVGPIAGLRTAIARIDNTTATSRSLTTDATPVSGDYAIYFAASTNLLTSLTVTSSGGASLQSTANPRASGVLAGGLLGAAGAVSSTFGFTSGATGEYEIIVVVAETPKAGLQLRTPLVVLESVDTGNNPQLRAPFLLVEDLSDSFRNLRCALLLIESLHPVDPGGHVSTQIFPGSIGSSVSLPGIAFPFKKRPGFATINHVAASGVSARTAIRQYPIWEIEFTYEFLSDDRSAGTSSLQSIEGFFLARLGGWDTFLWKDPNDYNVAAQPLGTGDGVTTQFFFKRTLGGFAEKVGQVDNGNTINIYKNGVLQGSGYTVTLPNSVVFATAPAAGVAITADFQFFYNVRFKEDVNEFEQFASKLWTLQTVTLETVPQ